ncbi:MAG: HNH endonuclease signature motif containing protein [Gemmatimonadaceae bacterium]
MCAYCGGTYAARTLTLDHVTPRRGQTAYDRRDNLVLACKRCNSAKADKPFLTYLLANRSRAKHLYVYGQHLSHGILDMLRHMVGHEVDLQAPRETAKPTRHVFGSTDDEESPYREESPYKDDETASPARGSSRRGARQPRAEGRPSKSRPRKPASRDKQRQPKQRGGRGRRSA